MAFFPSHLFYLLSLRCNERCSKCDHWRAAHHPVPPPVDRVVELIRQIPSATELCLVGGEPLVQRDRVLAILDGLADTALRTTIVTNGTLCVPPLVERIRPLNIHLVFSIDTLDPDFWLVVRGKPSFQRVMANFDYARRALAPSQLSVQSVLAEETRDHVDAVAEMCRRFGLYHSVQDYLQEGFNGQWTPLSAMSPPSVGP